MYKFCLGTFFLSPFFKKKKKNEEKKWRRKVEREGAVSTYYVMDRFRECVDKGIKVQVHSYELFTYTETEPLLTDTDRQHTNPIN